MSKTTCLFEDAIVITLIVWICATIEVRDSPKSFNNNLYHYQHCQLSSSKKEHSEYPSQLCNNYAMSSSRNNVYRRSPEMSTSRRVTPTGATYFIRNASVLPAKLVETYPEIG
jgi:hypothetical protein